MSSQTNGYTDEQRPLLGDPEAQRRQRKTKIAIHSALVVLFVGAIILFAALWENGLPKDPHAAAKVILDRTPIIDGHIDLPIFVRGAYAYNTSAFDLNSRMPQHVDIPRLREGRVGGFFWSLYMDCPKDAGADFANPTDVVRDTLEQIDISRMLIDQYSDTFQFAGSAEDVRTALRDRKIASLFGVEGAHQIANSLGTLRQYYALGVRYMTLTHACDNAFADGAVAGAPPLHGGLSPFGYTLVSEMNRIGMLVDLSHTTDATARQALKHTKAPVIWSHSSARALHDHVRNVPDDILEMLGTGEGKVDGVVMVNFVPDFIAAPGNASVAVVADHIEHIAKVAGHAHVGLGSDYDGINTVPVGLEDVSSYPNLFAELITRGWSRTDLAALSGGNFLRVFEGAERAAYKLRAEGAKPALDIYAKRPDLPLSWAVRGDGEL